jgi:hypothetical protein
LHLSKAGFAPSSNVEANTLSLFRWHPTILSLRMISLLGLACSLSGLLFLGLWLFTSSRDNPETLIRLKYGGLLVNVQDQNIELGSALINVTSIDELAKLAERHNTVILHMAFNFLHSYMVQCNGLTYRYVARSNRAEAYEIEPAHREMIQRAYDVASDDSLRTETADNDLFGYVLSKSRFEKGEVAETTILRKIQL